MMTRLIVFALLLTQFVCQAQTNISVIYSFVNGLGQTQTVKQVSFTPLAFGLDGKAYVVGDETFRVITSASYTNPMLSGFSYRVKYFSTIQPPTLTACFTNSFSTNVTGTVYAADYTAISTNLSNGLYAYSMAASDALFASLNQSTNIALVAAKNATNGLPSSVWTLGTASAQNTNVFLGTNFTVTTLNGLTNKFSVDSTGKGTLTIGNTNSTFSNVVTNGAGLNYPAPGLAGSLAGNGGGVGGLGGFLLYPNSGAGAGYLAKYDSANGVELYYPDLNGSTSTLLADQSHNLYVPAGLYDGSQSTGAPGAILCSTGSGGVFWNNYMTAQMAFDDSPEVLIASHDYGDGFFGTVSIGNINRGGGSGGPNNGLVMTAQAGNTTITMDADTGDALFDGKLNVYGNLNVGSAFVSSLIVTNQTALAAVSATSLNDSGAANVNTLTVTNRATLAGTNLFITTPSSASATVSLGLDANGRVTTNVTAGGSVPNGLVTNYSGAPISVTNSSGTATTISSNSIVITNGIFKTTLGTGLTLNGGVLTLGQTNGNSKLWSIYTTNNNMYIDGAVGGGGQNLYFGTLGGNTIAALNFSGVNSFQSCPTITVSTYIGTDAGNDYWNKQTIGTLDPLTIFGAGGNSHNFFQFPNAFGSTVITNGSLTAPCVTVCGQTGGTGDLFQWRDGATLRSSITTNGIHAAVGFSSTGTHTPVAVAVGASPFNFTNNTGSALECYFSGATAYTIGKNGVTVFASMIANDYFILQPSSYATVTYTVAPTFLTNSW